MGTTSSIAWSYIDKTALIAHHASHMLESDFDAMLDDIMRQSLTSVVVRAGNAAPNARHRALLKQWYLANSIRAAILTDSVVARGGVTVLRWFGASVCSFAPDEFEAAFAYVGLDPSQFEAAKRGLEALMEAVSR